MAEPRRSAGSKAGDLKGARILLVEARFYEDIADALLKGATHALEAAGAAVERVSVPGSLEVAPAIAILLDAAEQSGKPYEGVVALGCVIRGETAMPSTLSIYDKEHEGRAIARFTGGRTPLVTSSFSASKRIAVETGSGAGSLPSCTSASRLM